ncbi:MAG TPA: hypothetical protein VKR54_00085 [Candidatus Babeliales bacterium]|jgi:hypothetical protein|nr:hypothetical protein [Candidatus Babeliales bacterium]
MKNIEVVFQLNEIEKIVLEYQNPLDEIKKINLRLYDPLLEIDCCYEGLIRFTDKHQSILLSDESIRDEMQSFTILLRKALENELSLDTSINEDIGFMYNQYDYLFWTKDSIVVDDFVHELSETTPVWVGMRYQLWMTKKYVTWLYNDNNGLIIFEVTPLYPFSYRNSSKEQDYITYKKWIKNYKSCLTRTISREVAQQWFEQANKIEIQIADNIERWQREGRKN